MNLIWKKLDVRLLQSLKEVLRLLRPLLAGEITMENVPYLWAKVPVLEDIHVANANSYL